MEELKKEFKCKYCGKVFDSGQKLGGHYTHCKDGPNYEKSLILLLNARSVIVDNRILPKFINIKCPCPFCNNEYFYYGLKNHIVACTCNPDALPKEQRGNRGKTKSHIGWNKGLTKETDERVKKCGETYTKHYNEGLFESTGGYRENSAKSYKYGYYHGIFCNSSWELAYIIYCEEHNILISRNTNYLTYKTDDNKIHKFYPDFIINNEELVEIKGRLDPAYKFKQEQNPTVKFIFKEDMKEILQYVYIKYGKDFIKLYEY